MDWNCEIWWISNEAGQVPLHYLRSFQYKNTKLLIIYKKAHSTDYTGSNISDWKFFSIESSEVVSSRFLFESKRSSFPLALEKHTFLRSDGTKPNVRIARIEKANCAKSIFLIRVHEFNSEYLYYLLVEYRMERTMILGICIRDLHLVRSDKRRDRGKIKLDYLLQMTFFEGFFLRNFVDRLLREKKDRIISVLFIVLSRE